MDSLTHASVTSRPANRPRAKRRRLTLSARAGASLLAVIVLAAVAPVLFTRANPEQVDIVARLAPPSRGHPLGTDNIGRDLLARLVYGSRVSLLVALISVGGAVLIGVTLGLLAGYYGRWAEAGIMRGVDVFLAFPAILLALALIAVLGAGVPSVIIALVLVFWTQYARVVHGATLAEREKDYVEAARAIGAGDGRILVRHILPNIISPIIILATLGMGTAVVAESTLSFLGMGVQPPTPSWGWTLAFGTRYLRDAPHIATFSGLVIMATVLGFNLLGDGIRDLLDPKFRVQ
ncbi:MAG: binding-protein-dependent transport system inner membrane component [Armatimonadetes bacterium CSP1-3]|nr:MAG: binding-protein-dependent transport system inner membrane component [Armatimonadetes bacterium CSP1-3]